MKLKAVLFDLWGTLIEDPEARSRPRQVWRADNVRGVLRRHGTDLPFESVDSALVAGGAALQALHDTGVDVSAAGRVDLFLDQLASRPALPPAALALIQQAICTMHPVHRPEVGEGAIEALRQVKEMGLATALVSNAGYTTAPNLLLMLNEYGLARYLDACVFSDDLELAKPHPGLFAAALTKVGAEAPEAAFVGDSPHNDIYGARQAGLLAIQIGRREAPPRTGYAEADGARPHASIDSLTELLEALSRLEDGVTHRASAT